MIKLMDIIKEIEYPMAQGDDQQAFAGYAGHKGKIVWMSPDRFLELAYPLTRPFQNSLDDLEKKMKENHPIDYLMLMIDPQRRKVTTHNGRHRAMTAKKLGIEKVPVLVMAHIWDKRVPYWTKAQHNFIDKADFKPEKDPDEPID